MLAQKFGDGTPGSGLDAGRRRGRDAALREALLKVHELAAAYFREQLATAAGARGAAAARDRDVTAQTIERLGLGYAPRADARR